MPLRTIPVDSVIVPEGRLDADLEWTVPNLVQSLREVGLLHPITVTPNDDSSYILIAGRNRLEAARQLGWSEIPASVREYGPRDCELAELTENLHRRLLGPADRDRLIARYVTLCRMPRTMDPTLDPPFDSSPDSSVAPSESGWRPKCAAYAHVARQIGLSEMSVRRAVQRSALDDEDRAALEDAGLSLGEITTIASIKRKEERDRLIVLCKSGLSLQDSQIVLELSDDEIAGILVIQSTTPLTPAELIDVVWQDDVDRQAIVSLLAASMPFADAMREVLGDRWTNDPLADGNLSDADWADRHCGELACYRNSDHDTFVRAVGTYRQVQAARIDFERAIGWPDKIRIVDGASDPYRSRLVRFLSAHHPRQWVGCPGRVNRVCYRGRTSQGTCDRCQGAGFLIG